MKLQYALVLHQQGQLDQAQKLYEEVLRNEPKNFDALHLLGVLHTKQKNLQTAKSLIFKAIQLHPSSAIFYYNYGILQNDLKEYQDAIKSYDQAIAIQPNLASAFYNRGNSYQSLKQFDSAIVSYDNAIAIDANHAESYSSRGAALKELKQYDASVASCKRAIFLQPNLAAAYSNLGNTLLKLKLYQEALLQYEHAIKLQPNYAEAFLNRGIALGLLKEYHQALKSYQTVLQLNPQEAKAHFFSAGLYSTLQQNEEAISSYNAAARINPHIFEEIDYGYGWQLHTKMLLCDWHNFHSDFEIIEKKLTQNSSNSSSMPFELVTFPSTDAQQQLCAERYIQDEYFEFIPDRPIDRAAAAKSISAHKKIKIAYISSDFRLHPVGLLTVGLFEAHNRNRFDVYGVGLKPMDGTALCQRLSKSFDKLIDVSGMSTEKAVEVIRELEVDIAIDLNGHTNGNLTAIFHHRLASIQVNYLGYPGTMGAHFMDYIIADHTVIPLEKASFYNEKVVRLPNSFFVSSYKQIDEETRPTRREHQLPEYGFVFCCFNNSYKITPDVFNVWMRLLAQVEGSVLWLSKQSIAVTNNLRREAEERGIASERLVFAQKLDSYAAHIARYALADIFIDTIHYNAHTTAADALWAGLPVLTCFGKSFASRVAASLLRALGLNELVTLSITEYEALALDLAQNPHKILALKNKLKSNKLTHSLFDTNMTTRHLEAAYEQMHCRFQQGLKPDTINLSV